MRAIVTGMVATYALGGVVWDYLQYALGLERLGFEVFYLEDTGAPAYDPVRREYGEDGTFGARFLEHALQKMSPALASRFHFRSVCGQTFGMSIQDVQGVVSQAGLFLNVSGSCLLRDEYLASPRKVLIDTDPGYNHFVNYPRQDAGDLWPGTQSFRAHDHFFTYAECLNDTACTLPDFGLIWQPTRPLVLLDKWSPEPPGVTWTTVLTWNNFVKPIQAAKRSYGTKEREFPKVEALPQCVSSKLEIAAGGAAPPCDRWRQFGWSVIDSHDVSRTAAEYRAYIQQSRGEFSVAKNVYVDTQCGWFSCRSVCYLAAGRPVVVQDTGFSKVIPTGEGLFAFTDLESAATCIAAAEKDYAQQQRTARHIAGRYFAHDVVLTDLLRRIGLS